MQDNHSRDTSESGIERGAAAIVVVREVGEPQCQALNLSDTQRCIAEATAHDGLFCRFHARQCFGLYMGYKRRNAELDARAAQEPAFLHASKTALASSTFDAIVSEDQVREVHEYLFGQYVLLGKVIAARKLHHKHFFSLEMDYGHKAYLDKLVSTRHSVVKALESLERRTAQLLYEKEKWFTWVRQVQHDEDQNRENEQKKVKLEAALFRRHWREMEARLAASREKEEKLRQEAYLDEVWKERMATEPNSDSAAWDPIEDVFEEDRGRYLDLIRHFLWMEPPASESNAAGAGPPAPPPSAPSASEVPEEKATALEDEAAAEVAEVAEVAQQDETQPTSEQTKKPKKRGGKKKKNKTAGQPTGDGVPSTHRPEEAAMAVPKTAQVKKNGGERKQGQEPNKAKIEGKDEIRARLREGVKKDYSHVNGPMLVGTAHNPHELLDRTAPVSDHDISDLIADITEIKMLLFCRQVMSHSTLLPAALRANSIDEFLSDPSIADSDLRDLCLQVEQPTLQALRDACADFVRGNGPDDDEDEDQGDDEEHQSAAANSLREQIRYGDLAPDRIVRALNALYRDADADPTALLDSVSGDDQPRETKMKVRICGCSIWNYASQSSMARAGWLHFSIMAKDCDFKDAIGLCRNWDEFFELNFLALWQYFPASKWTGWSGNFLTEELTQLVCPHQRFCASAGNPTVEARPPVLTLPSCRGLCLST